MGTYQLLSKYPNPAFVLSILVSFLFCCCLNTQFDKQRADKHENFYVEVNSINEMSLTQSQIVVDQMCAILVG
jgi:hypothetical protein